MAVITRFAPSPTGYLHIGSARTALFNLLFARHHNGQFLLRIEDTDRARSTQEAVDAILEGLQWLDITWNGDVIYQSQCFERHAEIAQQMLDMGRAYRCYCTHEELQVERDRATQEGRFPRYNGRCRELSSPPSPSMLFTVRLKANHTGATVLQDHVQGQVTVANDQLDDFILLRSDGTPTYMLSVVVDDYDMKITHIIRGDDHLTNAFRQMQIYEAMGWKAPEFAHIPLIHGPDGAKLSKRHGALGVEGYHAMGLLPEALTNYLLRLGWSHGDDEIISRDQAIAWFELDGIGKSPARLDMAKLTHLNAHYLRAADDKRLIQLIQAPLEQKLGKKLSDTELQRLLQGMEGLKQRAKTLLELEESTLFYVQPRPLPFDEKARSLLDTDALNHLRDFSAMLVEIAPWTHTALEEHGRLYAEKTALKLGQLAQPLRAALTGQTVSPGIFEVMEILGKEETLGRIKDSVDSTQCSVDCNKR